LSHGEQCLVVRDKRPACYFPDDHNGDEHSGRFQDEPSVLRNHSAVDRSHVVRTHLGRLRRTELGGRRGEVHQPLLAPGLSPKRSLKHPAVCFGGPMADTYVHGYNQRENQRLQDQAGTLVELLHRDTHYPAGSRVLEAGCGVGAQTVTLAQRSPEARFTSVDLSGDSIAEARRRADLAGLKNVEFRQADIFALPFPPESFDHVFACRSRNGDDSCPNTPPRRACSTG
jgi:hypothetical protein